MKIYLITAWLMLILGGISFIFWRNELKYSLPTPVPENYHSVPIGETVDLSGEIKAGTKPVFIHFFNPDCPCSKFNLPHFKSLVKKHNNEFDFYVVVINSKGNYLPEEIKDKFDIPVPILFDKSIAISCGVYSTPQAVILDEQRRLYYRGNYNQSRYCSNPNTEYARMAIDSFLMHRSAPTFNAFATTAYGCQVNYCSK